MKTITFHGKEYSVYNDAKWITLDEDGIYTWLERPWIHPYDGRYARQVGMQKISEEALKMICEEIK